MFTILGVSFSGTKAEGMAEGDPGGEAVGRRPALWAGWLDRLAAAVPDPAPQHISRPYLIQATGAALALVIFIVDSLTAAEVAAGVLYVVVVLLLDRVYGQRGVLAVGLGCMVLTLVSLPLSPDEQFSVLSLSNALLSIIAIGGTTFLLLRNKAAATHLQQVEAELARVSRVTTLGALTAAIAHEVNQPLTGVVSSANACLHWLAGDAPDLAAARRSLERVIADGTRAGEVVKRIRALVRRTPPSSEKLNMNEVIGEVLALLGTEISRTRISLRTELAPDMPDIVGDRVQLQQVLLNLIMNAIEAMSGTGQPRRELLIAAATEGPGRVLVTVQDTGTGLDPKALDRLYEPFYTTKPRGMGMGLAISRTIVEAHGGQLRAAPVEPRGARFTLLLPVDGAVVP